MSEIARFPGAVEVPEELAEPDPELAAGSWPLVDQALDALVSMRAAEGARLREDLSSSLAAIGGRGGADRGSLGGGAGGKRAGPSSIACASCSWSWGSTSSASTQEVARARRAPRRRRGSPASAQPRRPWPVDLMGAGEPCGKRLDFLAQELMREANTVGSKVGVGRARPGGGGAQGRRRALPRAGAER